MREVGSVIEEYVEAGASTKGIYNVKLYGKGGSLLYEAYFPHRQGFTFVCPTHYDGMHVYGFEVAWEE